MKYFLMLKYFLGSTSDYSSMSPEELSHSSREGLLNTSKEDSTTDSTTSSSPSSGKCEEEEKEEEKKPARSSRRHSWAGGSPPGGVAVTTHALQDFKALLALKKLPPAPTPPAVELTVSSDDPSQVFGSSYRKKTGGRRELSGSAGFSVIQEEREVEESKENLAESEE